MNVRRGSSGARRAVSVGRLVGSKPISTSLLCAAAGLVGWLIFEPIFEDGGAAGGVRWSAALYFPVTGGLIAAVLTACASSTADRLSARVVPTACAFAVGVAALVLTMIPARLIFLRMTGDATSMGTLSSGTGLAQITAARLVSWAIVGGAVGQAFALCSNACAGRIGPTIAGAAAGLLGATAFETLTILLAPFDLEFGSAARLAGFCVVGGMSGLTVGVSTALRETAVIRVLSGASREVSYQAGMSPIFIGSGSECHVKLPDRGHVRPRHAALFHNGLSYELHELDPAGDLLINGRRVRRTRLRSGDQITIGGVRMLFSISP